MIRSLALVYALAGADCIDVAADPVVIASVYDALEASQALKFRAPHRGVQTQAKPFVMVSLNDGEDPHFRKAIFDPAQCPTDCTRPCEAVCPTQAIAPQSFTATPFHGSGIGVLQDHCYGCGRCLPVCPIQQITAQSYVSAPHAVVPQVLTAGVDAIEIHTQVGRYADFDRLWQAIAPYAHQLKLLAISCPDGEGFIDYLRSLYQLIQPLSCPLIWQVDGRPMSGDIGAGTTHATIQLAQKLLACDLPGFIQLAGGTNHHTVPKLQRLGFLPSPYTRQQPHSQHQLSIADRFSRCVAGVAYGSYARKLVSDRLESLDSASLLAAPLSLETCPELLWPAVETAASLVSQLKQAQVAVPLSTCL